MIVLSKVGVSTLLINRDGLKKFLTERVNMAIQDGRIIELYNSEGKIVGPYTEFQISGQPAFGSIETAASAIGDFLASFKPAGGTATPTPIDEEDPVFEAWYAKAFDENGILRSEFIPQDITARMFKVVTELPDNPESGVIYMTSAGDGKLQMHLWGTDQWIVVGDFTPVTDLSAYYTTTQTQDAIRTAIQTALANYVENDANALHQLQNHITDDQARWESTLDLIVSAIAEAKAYAQKLYEGTTPVYDYAAPTTIVGTGGLISLVDVREYTFTGNGAITCQVGGLLGVAMTVTVTKAAGGTATWTSPIFVLGLQISGDKNPSDEIQVSTGDVVNVVGVLGVGQTLNITFYPNKLGALKFKAF